MLRLRAGTTILAAWCLFTAPGVLAQTSRPEAPKGAPWIARSNENAQLLLQLEGQLISNRDCSRRTSCAKPS